MTYMQNSRVQYIYGFYNNSYPFVPNAYTCAYILPRDTPVIHKYGKY